MVNSDARVTVYVNSPGGSVYEGRTIGNLLARHEGPTNIVVDGICASAATYLLCAADTAEAYSDSIVMVHYASILTWGNRFELQKDIDLLQTIDDGIIAKYMELTGLDREELENLCECEAYMDATTAKANGFITAILEPRKGKKEPRKGKKDGEDRGNTEGTTGEAGEEPTAAISPDVLRVRHARDLIG